jgi:hypothetical protein
MRSGVVSTVAFDTPAAPAVATFRMPDSAPLPEESAPEGTPKRFDDIGSLSAFWEIIEPILELLGARRLCEVGVAGGKFAQLLLAWSRRHGAVYYGVDPAPTPAFRMRFEMTEFDSAAGGRSTLVTNPSLEVLPTLELCDAYFLDGDHNYHTVRSELELIEKRARRDSGDARPIVFLHDVAWPWGRRDMYYASSTVPANARHPSSDQLGVLLGTDELVDGGMRTPGLYSIALHAGGPKNGVLTAVEDFLSSPVGNGWTSMIVPAAYGLGILYQPSAANMPAACREHLRALDGAVALLEKFLRTYETNHQTLFLWSEQTRLELETERGYHHEILAAYRKLEEAYQGLLAHSNGLEEDYRKLEQAYQALLAHSNALEEEYRRLLSIYTKSNKEHAGV